MFKFKLAENDSKLKELNLSPVTPLIDTNKLTSIDTNLNIKTLDYYCRWSMELHNDLITLNALTNMFNYIQVIDKTRYYKMDAIMARLNFIYLVMKARVKLELSDKNVIYDYVLKNEIKYKDIIKNDIIPMIEDSSSNRLSNEIIKYINSNIAKELAYSMSVVYSKKLLNILDERQDENKRYSDEHEFANRIYDISNNMSDYLKHIILSDDKTEIFDLSDNFDSAIYNTMSHLKHPGHRLKTGIKYLNKMLNGGFKSSAAYLFGGITGIGKSIFLLTMAEQIRKYNKGVVKDKSKRGIVLYITLENDMYESIERLFNITVTNDDMVNYDYNEVKRLLREKAGLKLESSNDVDLAIIKKENRSITINDIDAMIMNYAKRGKEVICVVLDYIQRLRALNKYTEVRHEFGELANDLEDLSKKYDIPVISACQLNRAAMIEKKDANMRSEKDAAKLLGKQNAAESWEMIENIDTFIAIDTTIDDRNPDAERKYMAFNLDKFRGKPNKNAIRYFVHPFEIDNGIRLIEDLNSKESASFNSMKDAMRDNPLLGKSNIQTVKPLINNVNLYTSEIDSLDSFNGQIPDANYDKLKKAMIKLEIEKMQASDTIIQKNWINILQDKNKKKKYKKNYKNRIIIDKQVSKNKKIKVNNRIYIESNHNKKELIEMKDNRFIIDSRK